MENTPAGRKAAETLAAQAFSWVAEDAGRLNAFMAMTGAGPADVVRNATSARFLGTVLDYILTEDALVIAFCDSQGIPYPLPIQARALLPGGEIWNWT
ncbi:MAG: DUF3572 domain-containing protein [Candidatus Saccharibacteria bacterium]|nr:DUF3572 domain-containing protein [Pseudorhodobacter sp.]